MTKITEALCNWIQSKGETPTEEDLKSITHALQSLYYAKGGQGEIPAEYANSIADMINGIAYADEGGGGGTTMPICSLTVSKASTANTEVSIHAVWDAGGGEFDFNNFTYYGGSDWTQDVGACALISIYPAKADKTITVSNLVNCYVYMEGTYEIVAGNTRPCIILGIRYGKTTASFSVTVA